MPQTRSGSARKPRARRDAADDSAPSAAAEDLPAPSALCQLDRTDVVAWDKKEVRYKVVIWELQGDKIDLVEGNFEAKFRVTVFWEPRNLRAVSATNCATDTASLHLAVVPPSLRLHLAVTTVATITAAVAADATGIAATI
jgi:hypothetical protein